MSQPPAPTSGAIDDDRSDEIIEAQPLTRIQLFIAQPVMAAFMAGGVAGAVSRTVVSPLERLKILFQVQSGAGKNAYQGSVWKGLQKIWREEGMSGMLRGNGTNCIRIVPYSAVQFGSYNFYKRVREPPIASMAAIANLRT
jgi:solute carrier family 25 (mitochondrial phosphate transporter), member 23/24/25/41